MSALDELRFGPNRILNLREHLPTAAEAVRRADLWIREQQVKGSKEVLVITGRGSQSIAGVAVIRGAVEKLLFSLRRRGVVAGHHEHNPGAFVAELAPLRALVDAPSRHRDRSPPRALKSEIHGLSQETIALLRELAERALTDLGVAPDESQLEEEMHRQLGAIAPALPPGDRMEDHLRAALRTAIQEYD